MKVDVRLFATLRERVGEPLISLEIPEPATVTDLMSEMSRRYPVVQRYEKNILISVNQEYASLTQSISSNDEIAIFPPVSGG